MNAIEILEYEHQLILDVLRMAQAQARLLAISDNMPVSKEPGMADFCAKFISRCHHAKEFELFVTLLQKGRSYVIGPITSFRAEHSHLCQLTASLAVVWKLRDEGQAGAAQVVAEYLTDYAGLMHDHIQKENRFYQVVSEILDDTDHLAIKAAFDRLDGETLGTDGHDRYCRWAHEFSAARH